MLRCLSTASEEVSMGKVEQITVTKGKTIKASDRDEWNKVEYSINAAVDDQSDLQAAKAALEGLIDGWLTSVSTPVAVAKRLPQLDPDELAKLPWKTYRAKEPCKPDEAGWIFRNAQGADALVDLIEKQGNGVTVEIGGQKFEVKFSGAEKQFVGRAPIKEKQQ